MLLPRSLGIKNLSLEPSIARTSDGVIPVPQWHKYGAETAFLEEQ
jgi:hypothetical protein